MLVLASASERRRELLSRAGIPFQVVPADLDETPRAGEAPVAYAKRIAAEKAQAVSRAPDQWVLAADTIVVMGEDILGKPQGPGDAGAMLRRLSGRTHAVVTAVCLVAPGEPPTVFSVTTEVDMRALEEAEITAYVQSGEWRGKAGGYAVQGIAAAFVTGIRGSYTNVVGLPLSEVVAALAARGGPRADFARGVPA